MAVTIDGKPLFEEILAPEALAFVEGLEREFGPTRRRLLNDRRLRQAQLDGGELPDFLPETELVRTGDWRIGPVLDDLLDRRVEITGPVDRKMIINALNSGANAFMADFEDSNSPSWSNVMTGQINLRDAVQGTIRHEQNGKTYQLASETATLLVRPRGWHLDERHLTLDGHPLSASLVDFGLFLFHNAQALVDKGSGPYFYLPKLENHREARLWNDVFVYAQEGLGIPLGTIKATVLLETILAAFEMDEILHELRDHSAGLNAGRWDYIFSVIKKFRSRPDFLLPDRAQVTMKVPFMSSYTDLLIQTCHRRGAHAMGGMAAFIPSRDEEVNARALRKVTEDKELEAAKGHDGTWVAHPGLVAIAKDVFDRVLGARPNQIEFLPDGPEVTAKDLLHTEVSGGVVTEAGVRTNVNVGIRYLAAWLDGNGAAAIFNLMEDAATAEISRSQIWQWTYHGAKLDDGRTLTADLVSQLIEEEFAAIRAEVGDSEFMDGSWNTARSLFDQVALTSDFEDFLTIPAYEFID